METTTVMVVDLVGSTRTIAAVPQVRMDELMAEAVLPIRRVVEDLGGEIIKFTGDGYLTAFRAATTALHAAAQIVELFVSAQRLPIGEEIEGCRVAIHTCDVTRFENDLLGEGVVVPARMEKHVPTNTVYVTSTVRDAAKSAEFDFELVGELALSGLPRPVETYRLMAEEYRGVERSTFLTVTDLVGLNALAARIPLTALNRRLREWVTLHREALGATGGRLRSVAGDNVLSTHTSADAAVEFLLTLDRLTRGAADGRGGGGGCGQEGGEQEGRGHVGDGERSGVADDGYLGAAGGKGRGGTDEERGTSEERQPPFAFSAVVAHGDLFVPDFGLAGPLVSRACRTLQALEPETKMITTGVYGQLTTGHESFGPESEPVSGGLVGGYHLFARSGAGRSAVSQ